MTRVLSLLFVAASLLVQTTPSVTGYVSGRVTDADTRMPIAGAKVGSSTLGWTLTAADGHIRSATSLRVR